jgi:hypothetical protein
MNMHTDADLTYREKLDERRRPPVNNLGLANSLYADHVYTRL